MKANTRRLIFFSILMLLVTCCNKNRLEIYETAPDSILVNKIRKEVFIKLLVEDDLHPCGTGAQMMDEIKMLYFAFHYYHEINIENARKLITKAGDSILNKINGCEKIRPYLVNYPFKPENVEVAIFLNNPDGSKLPPEKLRAIIMKKGSVKYENGILDSNGYDAIVCEETYEEALAKLQQELKETNSKNSIKI